MRRNSPRLAAQGQTLDRASGCLLPGLGFLTLLRRLVLFRGSIYEAIETVEPLVLLLHKATLSNCSGWRRSLPGGWRDLRVVAVQPLFALIFNLKTSAQRLQWSLRHREGRHMHARNQDENVRCLHSTLRLYLAQHIHVGWH